MPRDSKRDRVVRDRARAVTAALAGERKPSQGFLYEAARSGAYAPTGASYAKVYGMIRGHWMAHMDHKSIRSRKALAENSRVYDSLLGAMNFKGDRNA